VVRWRAPLPLPFSWRGCGGADHEATAGKEARRRCRFRTVIATPIRKMVLVSILEPVKSSGGAAAILEEEYLRNMCS